mmetsp:Transcript_100932/g.323982  ORF Transcript_100932/g.323982 Transcript_100932/m.323982 type:complete len:326 (+) Transcript_100932:137-1114(+)
MGAAACRQTGCESACATVCTTEDLKYVEELCSMPLDEYIGAVERRSDVRPWPQQRPACAEVSSGRPEANLETDLEELRRGQFAPPQPEGTCASVTLRSGSVYSGQWKGHCRHGFGYQTWRDGASYSGQWLENVAVGMGVYNFPDGSVYVGEWQHNRFHGLGAYYGSSKTTVFRGEWQGGFRQGYGVEEGSTSVGATFRGTFNRGLKEGSGICSWSDGGEYAGQWKGNHIIGSGTYVCKDVRRRYKGQWLDSQKDGVGHYEWPDGRAYRGQYYKDQASGFGAFSWPDGQRYEGHWNYGKQHGSGLYTAPGGEQRELTWIDGRPKDD